MKAYSPYISPRYKGNGRPRKQDYKSFKDRHVEQIPSLIILMVTVVGAMYLTPVKYEPLISPIPVQASENEVMPTPTPTPEMPPTKGWEGFERAVDRIAPLYNFPKNVVLAQAALESAHGNSNFSKDRNNYLGIGAYDSDPNQAFRFENSEQCVIEYMRIIKRNFPEAWAQRDNPEALLKALKVNSKGMMYATDPLYVQKVMSMREWDVK